MDHNVTECQSPIQREKQRYLSNKNVKIILWLKPHFALCWTRESIQIKMLEETWSRWHIIEIKFGAIVFHHILHAVVRQGRSIPVWPVGLLQVLLPLLLALAALHGHLEQPPAPHAQPEEQGLQLEQMNLHTMKGRRKSPSMGRGCPPRRARVPEVPQLEGTMALHQALGISL